MVSRKNANVLDSENWSITLMRRLLKLTKLSNFYLPKSDLTLFHLRIWDIYFIWPILSGHDLIDCSWIMQKYLSLPIFGQRIVIKSNRTFIFDPQPFQYQFEDIYDEVIQWIWTHRISFWRKFMVFEKNYWDYRETRSCFSHFLATFYFKLPKDALISSLRGSMLNIRLVFKLMLCGLLLVLKIRAVFWLVETIDRISKNLKTFSADSTSFEFRFIESGSNRCRFGEKISTGPKRKFFQNVKILKFLQFFGVMQFGWNTFGCILF